MIRLDKRFSWTALGWGVQSVGDMWPDLVRALPTRLADALETIDLLRQVIREMSAATRADWSRYYPDTLALPDSLCRQIADLIQACPDEAIARLRGPIFDLVLSYVFDDSSLNRFFTPRAITSFAAAWACPKPGEHILDPCFGSGGFLLALAHSVLFAGEELENALEATSTAVAKGDAWIELARDGASDEMAKLAGMLYGMDRHTAAHWSGMMNLELHGLPTGGLRQCDALDLASCPFGLEHFDIVAGNPPFGEKVIDLAILEQFDLGRDGKGQLLAQQISEVLFLEAFLRYARPGARVIILLPDGLLTNVTEQRIRDYIVKHALVDAVVALPRRVFRNDAKSNVLLLRKKSVPEQRQEQPAFLASVRDIHTELAEALQRYLMGPDSR